MSLTNPLTQKQKDRLTKIVWQALKDEACVNPKKAIRIVLLTEDKVARALLKCEKEIIDSISGL